MKTRIHRSSNALFCLILSIIALGVERSPAATLFVTNNNDAGAGSLRQAIQDNLTAGGNQTIQFGPAVTGTITLLSQLSISVNVSIVGPGTGVLNVSGN